MPEPEDITLRGMLRQHMDNSYDFQTKMGEFQVDMKEILAEVRVRAQFAADKVETHETKIERLTTTHNQQKGAIGVIGAIGMASLVHAVKNWFGL